MVFVDQEHDELILRMDCLQLASKSMGMSAWQHTDVIQYAEALYLYATKGEIPSKPLAKAA